MQQTKKKNRFLGRGERECFFLAKQNSTTINYFPTGIQFFSECSIKKAKQYK